MKKFVTVLFILVSIHGNAQIENSLLWKIEGNGLKNPSHLFGTIHAMCPNELNIAEKVKKALDASQQLVLEVDMDDPDFMTKLQQASVNPSMKNINTEISEADLALANNFFLKNYGTDLSQLGILKPMGLISMVIMKALNCEQPGSYEAELMKYAQKHKWEVFGLEEVELQLTLLDEIPIKQQLSFLVNYIKDREALNKSIEDLISAYTIEDISKLNVLIGGYPEYTAIKGVIFDKRNESWIPTIEKFASEKTTFFAVGAGHLAGDKGVINLLRARGYIVTPILEN
jgi:uncharacterized protein YbaP (TraB family)